MEKLVHKNLLTEILPLEKDAWTFEVKEGEKDINKCVRTIYKSLKKVDFLKLSKNGIEAQDIAIKFLKELYKDDKKVVEECENRKGYHSFLEKNSEILNKKTLKECHLNQIRELFEDSMRL